jgi:penicillin-binding protein 2
MFRSRIDDDQQQRLRFSRRALVFGTMQTAAFGVLASKLYQVQVLDGQRLAPLAEDNRINIQMLAPARGRILDRTGLLLADNADDFRAIIIPSLAGNLALILERVSRLIPLEAEERDKLIARAKRQQPNVPLIVAGALNFSQIASLNLQAPHLPGVQIEAASTRRYFSGDAVGHVVGHVGHVDRVGIDDDPILRLPGLKVGRTGVERGLDDRLRGGGGAIKHEIDARGRIVRTLAETAPTRGDDVVLTIDTELQRKVGARLSRERRASSVVIDTQSGEVVAMVSVPTHNPSEIVKGVTARTWERMRQSGNDPMVNRAIRGQYPPGSTFKMVTALAALEAGVVDLEHKIRCEGQTELGGQTFRCWKRTGHGQCNFHRALRESCDCYFYEISNRVGIEAIAKMSRKLGLGQIFETGLAHQKPGVVPDPTWKRERFNKPWLGGETLLVGIGQGYVLATPLQLAVMTARLASGRSVVPQMVRAKPDGSVRTAFQPLDVRQKFLDAVRRAMSAVVNDDGGTGSTAQLEDDQPLVAGKTGTSQVVRASSDRKSEDLAWEQRDHALFVAYVPADKPRYAVSVVVEHGGGGGATAGPVIRDVIAAVLERDPSARTAYPELSVTRAIKPAKSG